MALAPVGTARGPRSAVWARSGWFYGISLNCRRDPDRL